MSTLRIRATLYPCRWLMPRRTPGRDAVYALIVQAVRAANGPVRIPMERLAERAGFSYPNIQIVTAQLVEDGKIIRQRENRAKAYVYSLPDD